MVLELLQDMLVTNHLIAAEHRAAVAIIKQLETEEINEKVEEIRLILNPPQVRVICDDLLCISRLMAFFYRQIEMMSIYGLHFKVANANFEQIAVSDLAEQMTLIDHKLFCALESEYVHECSLIVQMIRVSIFIKRITSSRLDETWPR
jgi:cellobiose-specific phosphotransferase system component IIB